MCARTGAFVEYIQVDSPEEMLWPWMNNPYFLPIVVSHAITFVVGLVGNAVVISAMSRSRGERSVTRSVPRPQLLPSPPPGSRVLTDRGRRKIESLAEAAVAVEKSSHSTKRMRRSLAAHGSKVRRSNLSSRTK